MSSRRRARKPAGPRPAEWDFFSFPVFFAFAFGMFVATFLIIVGLIDIVYLASLMLMAFGLAHLVTRLFARHRLERRREREEEAERERRALAARAAEREEVAVEAPPRRRRRRRRG